MRTRPGGVGGTAITAIVRDETVRREESALIVQFGVKIRGKPSTLTRITKITMAIIHVTVEMVATVEGVTVTILHPLILMTTVTLVT